MDAFYEWFLVLYEDTGINLPFLYDSYDRDRMIAGFLMTVKLSVTCLIFSVIIGKIGAWLIEYLTLIHLEHKQNVEKYSKQLTVKRCVKFSSNGFSEIQII